MSFLKRLFGESGADKTVEQQTSIRPATEIDAQGLAARLKQAQVPFLLDVREPYEYADGHIAGATLIPLGDLIRRASELPRDREIVCVCRSGNRSGAATRQLIAAGYDAINLSGGMIGWMRGHLPVQRGAGR